MKFGFSEKGFEKILVFLFLLTKANATQERKFTENDIFKSFKLLCTLKN